MRPGSTMDICEYPISALFGSVGGFMRTIGLVILIPIKLINVSGICVWFFGISSKPHFVALEASPVGIAIPEHL